MKDKTKIYLKVSFFLLLIIYSFWFLFFMDSYMRNPSCQETESKSPFSASYNLSLTNEKKMEIITNRRTYFKGVVVTGIDFSSEGIVTVEYQDPREVIEAQIWD